MQENNNLIDVDKPSKINSEIEMLDKEYAMKKQKLQALAAHASNCNYAINPPNPESNDPRWRVWVKKEGEVSRKRIVKATEEELYRAMYAYYYEKTEKLQTLGDLYPLFIEKRKRAGLSAATRKKDTELYNRFYKGAPIIEIKLKKLTERDVADFLNGCIIKNKLTRKTITNSTIIIKTLCDIAYQMELIDKVIYRPGLIDFSRCVSPKASKEIPTERALSEEDKRKLIAELHQELENKPKVTSTLAILLSFSLGLRVGELVALKISDIDFTNQKLYVRHSEKMGEDEEGRLYKYVDDDVKLNSAFGKRTIYINNEAMQIIKITMHINKLNHPTNKEPFLFLNVKGERYKAEALGVALKRLCERIGLPHSMHDIRRTVATTVYNHTHNIVTVQRILGHKSKIMTYAYIQDLIDDEEVKHSMDCLQSNTVPKCTQYFGK